MSTNDEITRNHTYFKSFTETTIVPRKEQVDNELNEGPDLEEAGEVVEC